MNVLGQVEWRAVSSRSHRGPWWRARSNPRATYPSACGRSRADLDYTSNSVSRIAASSAVEFADICRVEAKRPLAIR